MNRNQNIKNKRRKPQRQLASPKPRTRNTIQQDLEASIKIPRNLRGASTFPMHTTRRMTFIEPNLVLVDPLNSFVVREWRINDIYDPDPLIGGGTVNGYKELAAIYNQYHVELVRVNFTFTNKEPAFPLTFGMVFRDIRPTTTIVTFADALNILEGAPTTGINVIGQATGTSVFKSTQYKLPLAAILGNRELYYGDIGYRGSIGTTPAQSLWAAFIVLCDNPGGTIGVGATLGITFEFTTKWFSTNNLQE